MVAPALQHGSARLPLALGQQGQRCPRTPPPLPAKARQVRQEEGAQSPTDRDRPGSGHRRGHRLRRVLERQHRARLLPADEGLDQARRPVRPGGRQARRLRHPADLRLVRRGPVHGPGLRPGAGPVLRDGRAPPHDLRPALGDVRQGPGQDRRVPAHARLAPGGAEGVRHQAVGRHEEVPPGVRQGSQRLPRRARTARTSPWSTRRSGFTNDYAPAEVDPGRLGGLAQGDGLGPARQHAGRDRPLPDDEPPRPEADRRPVPGLPVRAGTRRSSRRARTTARTRTFDHGRLRPAPVPARTAPPAPGSPATPRLPTASRASCPGSPTSWTRSPRPSARTATASAPTPGWSPAAHTITGKPLLANDPHLSPSAAVGLVPDGPALPDRLPRASTTSPATPSRACPASSSATTRTSPGA